MTKSSELFGEIATFLLKIELDRGPWASGAAKAYVKLVEMSQAMTVEEQERIDRIFDKLDQELTTRVASGMNDHAA